MVCLENIFTVWSVCTSLTDTLSLPDDVVAKMKEIGEVCLPYLENGFTFNFDCTD